jgi:hypothetical protein
VRAFGLGGAVVSLGRVVWFSNAYTKLMLRASVRALGRAVVSLGRVV